MSTHPSSSTTPGPREGLLPDWLDWIEERNIAGIHVGVENRVRSLEAWKRMVETGSAPSDSESLLLQLSPILCRSSKAQGAYRDAVKDFLAECTKPPPDPTEDPPRRAEPGTPSGPVQSPFPWPWVASIVLFLLLVWWAWPRSAEIPESPGKSPILPPTNAAPFAGLTNNATFRYFTNVLVITNPISGGPAAVPQPSTVVGPSRTVAILCALGLLGWALDRLRRRLYLRQGPSIAEAQKALETDVETFDGTLERMSKDAAETLRQRRSGQIEAFDMPATLRATIRAAGMFSPRFRKLATTPSYLFLVQREHPRDHLASRHLEWIRHLAESGVACDVFLFRTTPEHGCRRWDPFRREADEAPLMALSSLLDALPSHRLVVMSDPDAGIDFLSGRPYRWVQALSERAEKAWFVPRRRAAWGRREATLSAAGLAVKASGAEAFAGLAATFGEGAISLEAEPLLVVRYPPSLQADPIGLLARTHAPDPETLETLVDQLRAYLGRRRFQWLCATCLFPAVSPGLTRWFGEALEAREGTLWNEQDRFALASLPFQRHAVIPVWLRRRLVRELGGEQLRTLRAGLTDFLLGMKAGRPSQGIPVDSPEPRPQVRHLWDWLGSRKGLAGDSVFVEFLNPGHLGPLAQRLPDAVRRRLFPDGVAAYGLKPWVAVGLLCLGLAAWAAPSLLPKPSPVSPVARNPLTFIPTNFLTTPAFTNSLGMVFVPVTNAGVWFSAWETRVQDYVAYATAKTNVDSDWRVLDSSGSMPEPSHPVMNISWIDATNFCHWLTINEEMAGRLPRGYRYRLPTDREWSAAVGLADETLETPYARGETKVEIYVWGRKWPPSQGSGNYADESARRYRGFNDWPIIVNYEDTYPKTAPTGMFGAVSNGLHDMSGNVWEWCWDLIAPDDTKRVQRGGSWFTYNPLALRLSARNSALPSTRVDFVGMRVVLATTETTP